MTRARDRDRRRSRSPEPRTGTRNQNDGSRTERRPVLRFWRAAVVAFAAAIVYANSLPAPFIFDDPLSRKVMGHAYLRLSRWQDAIAQLRMVLLMTPNDAEARRLLVDSYNTYGVTLAQAGDFGLAISQFKNALSLDDRNEGAQYNLATALFDAGRMDESFIASNAPWPSIQRTQMRTI